MATTAAGNLQSLCFKISATANLRTSTWASYGFTDPASANVDFPKLAIASSGGPFNAYVMVTQQGAGAAGAGNIDVYGFDRLNMLAGNAPRPFLRVTRGRTDNSFIWMPAVTESNPTFPFPSRAQLFEFDNPNSQLLIFEFTGNFDTPAATLTGPTRIPLPASWAGFPTPLNGRNDGNGPPQRDGVEISFSNNLGYRVTAKRFSTHTSLVAALHTNVGTAVDQRTGIFWFELRDTGSGWEMFQQVLHYWDF